MGMMRVALLQMASFGRRQESNRAKGEEFCRRAAAMGADIALFPEMWNIGYSYRAREAWGDAFRKPRSYGALTETEVRPPFVRSSARR